MTTLLVVCVALAIGVTGCNKREKADDAANATIAPAQSQTAAGGTDEAMTQTVNVEDGRSEAEGGSLNSTSTATTSTTAATATTTSTAAPPPASTTTR